LKCHKPFVYHKGSEKVPSCMFPIGTSYKHVTFSTITSTMPTNHKAKITAVVPVSASSVTSFTGHPVTTVFPGMSNPVDYSMLNMSNIISESGDSDSSMSNHLFYPAVSTVINAVDAAVPMVANVCSDIIALSVPHMFWRATAAMASLVDNESIKFNCLIDNGSHLVLIHDSFAKTLSVTINCLCP
jgi:hypothetical protein